MSAEDELEEIQESDKTPVTIITGFLGSGKTTLVNYILKEQTQWKICVIENEFGEVSIDTDLVEENLAAREDIITMDNGCVCCSVRGDLVRTFNMLVGKRKEFDAIIIETTGLADPSPIVFTFNSNTLIQDNYRIDSVVCLVDAKHVNIHLDDVKPEGNINEAEHQIAFADRIILNKIDLVSKDELLDVEDRIRAINSFAVLIRTEKSRAPLDKVLGLNSFSLEKMIEVDPTLMDMDNEEDDNGHVHDEHCKHDHSDSGHIHDEHCGHHEGHHEADHHGHGHDHGHGHGHEHDETFHITTSNGTLVLSIFEDGIPPVFRIRFENWTGPVPDATAVSVTTVRQPGDSKQLFHFSPLLDSATNSSFLQSLDSIPEPHEFKAIAALFSEEHSVDFKEHEHGHHDDEEHDHDHKKHDEHNHGHKHDEHDHGHKHDAHEKHDEHDCGHKHDEHDHAHGHGHEGESQKKKKKTHNLSLVSSVGFTIQGLLDVPKFNGFMSQLLQAKAADLYRTKGVLAFADQGDAKFVFQGVHEQINFGPSEKPWQPDEVRQSKMVFIGKNIDYEFLKTSLHGCCVNPETAIVKMHKRA